MYMLYISLFVFYLINLQEFQTFFTLSLWNIVSILMRKINLCNLIWNTAVKRWTSEPLCEYFPDALYFKFLSIACFKQFQGTATER